MKESDIIDILMNYSSGGNYFVLYKIIVNNSGKDNWCNLSQQEIANMMKKSRRFVNDGLKVLKDLGLVNPLYKKIYVVKRIDNE